MNTIKLNKYDIIIIGAGLAGLACADEILRKDKNKKVLILEKDNKVGGLSKTIQDGKFKYDLAPHRWFTKNDELNKWIDELLGNEMISVKKYTPMFQFGKFFDYPIRMRDVIKKINLWMQFVMFTTYAYEKVKSLFIKKKIVTMKDAYVSRFGYGLYKWFNEEYNDKLWGRDGCQTMSADFVNQRVKNLSVASAVMNALGFGKGKVISLIDEFRFPKLGIGRIADQLEKRIKNNKGEIKLEEPVIKIIKQNNDYKIITKEGEYLASKVISSAPLNVFLRFFESSFISPINKSLNKLKFVHQKIVVLKANKQKLTDFTWVYVHSKKIRTFRFLETNNWSEAMSPKGKTSLVFEYPYHEGDEIDRMSDQELIDVTIKDFSEHFAPDVSKEDIMGGKVYLVSHAYPKYDLHYKKALRRIKKFVKKYLDNVILIGRSGMFHYNNMDHSIYTGLLAARNILVGKNVYDLENVNNEAEYLEEIKKD